MVEQNNGRYCVEMCPYRTNSLRTEFKGPYICRATRLPTQGDGFEYKLCGYDGDFTRCPIFKKKASENVQKVLDRIAATGRA